MSAAQTISASAAKRPLFLGIDVGGTSIKLGVVDDLGRPLAQTKVPTLEEHGPQSAVRRAKEATLAMLEGLGLAMSDLAGIGLATPGTMDIPKGIFLEPHNLPHWHYFPIRDCVAEAFGLPVSFANDANAAAYGEFCRSTTASSCSRWGRASAAGSSSATSRWTARIAMAASADTSSSTIPRGRGCAAAASRGTWRRIAARRPW
jgi:hypothetical protein